MAFGGARERESNANAQNQLYTTVWFVSFLGGAMEGMVKKYQQKFRKVRDETKRWDELQSRLLSQFRNASSIIERLQSIQNSKNYGTLKCIDGIGDAVLRKQMESLETILLSLKKTL